MVRGFMFYPGRDQVPFAGLDVVVGNPSVAAREDHRLVVDRSVLERVCQTHKGVGVTLTMVKRESGNPAEGPD